MNGAVEIRNLRFAYPDGIEALRGVSFTVERGECLGLIGPNGAGKSTLLLHLNGLLPEKPSKYPAVYVDGHAVAEPNLHEIRRRVGLMFQDPNDQLFCPTVEEDVAFGPRQFGLDDLQIHQRVTDALAQVNLSGFEKRAPHHLSGGEKRRVCLAGVLACEPDVLALDEPTSNLDPRGRRELKGLLRRLSLTRIIATHDLEMVAELCSRVVLLDHGLVIAEGPAATLLADAKLMQEHDLEVPHILLHHPPAPIPHRH